MKMPPAIPENLLAPCGVNCLTCFAFLRGKNPCVGCLNNGPKMGHCQHCSRKECAAAQGLAHCHACEKFPCAKRIRPLEKTYRKKYGVSIVANGHAAGQGMAAFMQAQRQLYTCPQCGGVVCQHDGICSECGTARPLAPLE